MNIKLYWWFLFFDFELYSLMRCPTRAFEAVSSTLYYSMLQLWMNTYKRDEKLSNDTIFTQKLNYSIMYTFIQKAGIIQLNINKRTDKCHKKYIQNNYFLTLINSPQLDTLFVLKQSQVNLKKQRMIIKESRTNKFLKRKTNVSFKQKRTRQIHTYHNPTTTTYKRNES